MFAPVIQPGEEAPDFELPDQDGRGDKPGDQAGQMLVHYSYSKADTPG